MYVCRIFEKTSGGVRSSYIHIQGCLDISQMWHYWSLLLCPEFILYSPKAEVGKDKRSIYLQTKKQSSPPFFHVKHSSVSFLFLPSEWVGVVISIDVAVVTMLSY